MGLVVTAQIQLGTLQPSTQCTALVSILEGCTTVLGFHVWATCGRPVRNLAGRRGRGLAEAVVARAGTGVPVEVHGSGWAVARAASAGTAVGGNGDWRSGIVVSTICLIGFRGTILGGRLMAIDMRVARVAVGVGSDGATGADGSME